MLYRTKQGLDNLSRPHFKTTSWHFPNNINDWPSIDSIDTPLSRGSRFFGILFGRYFSTISAVGIINCFTTLPRFPSASLATAYTM